MADKQLGSICSSEDPLLKSCFKLLTDDFFDSINKPFNFALTLSGLVALSGVNDPDVFVKSNKSVLSAFNDTDLFEIDGLQSLSFLIS